jgi:hypothetical protein
MGDKLEQKKPELMREMRYIKKQLGDELLAVTKVKSQDGAKVIRFNR